MNLPDALASAAAGMMAQRDRLDRIAEDLANAATPGFEAGRRLEREFGSRLHAARAVAQTQGVLRRTGVATDLALQGSGFFAVVGADGVEYTRDGRMSVGAGGFLCDVRGRHVLGSLGPIRWTVHSSVAEDGRIVVSGHVVDRLRVVDFDGHAMVRSDARVHAGYLEDSGIEPIREMTALVGAERAYEANQKAAQRADDALRRATTDVPAVGR